MSTQKKFADVVDDFLTFIKDKRLIIHNAEFDLSHLNNELSLLNSQKISNEVIDTVALARDKYPGSPVSLDALCKRFKIDNSLRTQHTAIIDCELLAKVYINLIDQTEPKLDFVNHDENLSNKDNSKILYNKQIIKPTIDEIRNHNEFLKKNLKKNFF